MRKDGIVWHSGYRLEKRHSPDEEPYQVIEGHHNCPLNEGLDRIWQLVIGGSASHYNNAGALMVVGSGTQAANATQTGAQGTQSATAGMTTSYPTTKGETAKMYFKAEFGTAAANFPWQEWLVTDLDGVDLNRKVESLGTKSGGTWSLEVYLQLQGA